MACAWRFMLKGGQAQAEAFRKMDCRTCFFYHLVILIVRISRYMILK